MSFKILKIETNRNQPLFYGPPTSDIFNSELSDEGFIVKGTSVEEVYARDMQELQYASLNQESASRVLINLRFSILYALHHWIPNNGNNFRVPFEVIGFDGMKAMHALTKEHPMDPFSDFSHPRILTPEIFYSLTASTEVRLIFVNQQASNFNANCLRLFLTRGLLQKGNAYELSGNKIVQLSKCFNPSRFSEVLKYTETRIRKPRYIDLPIDYSEVVEIDSNGKKYNFKIESIKPDMLEVINIGTEDRINFDFSEYPLIRFGLTSQNYKKAMSLQYSISDNTLSRSYLNTAVEIQNSTVENHYFLKTILCLIIAINDKRANFDVSVSSKIIAELLPFFEQLENWTAGNEITNQLF